MLEPNINFDPRFDNIINLSHKISVQRGRNGQLDSPEQAVKKLFFSDAAKNSGDKPETGEIIEELQKNPIDLLDLAGEIADFMYYRAKIPNMPEMLETQLLSACGFTQFSAIKAAEVKYGARTGSNIAGHSKEERKASERTHLSIWFDNAIRFGLVRPESINPEQALDAINRLTQYFMHAITDND